MVALAVGLPDQRARSVLVPFGGAGRPPRWCVCCCGFSVSAGSSRDRRPRVAVLFFACPPGDRRGLSVVIRSARAIGGGRASGRRPDPRSPCRRASATDRASGLQPSRPPWSSSPVSWPKRSCWRRLPALGLFLVVARGVRVRYLAPVAIAGVVFVLLRTAALTGLQATGADSVQRLAALKVYPVLVLDGLFAMLTMQPIGIRHLSWEYATLGWGASAGAAALCLALAGGRICSAAKSAASARRHAHHRTDASPHRAGGYGSGMGRLSAAISTCPWRSPPSRSPSSDCGLNGARGQQAATEVGGAADRCDRADRRTDRSAAGAVGLCQPGKSRPCRDRDLSRRARRLGMAGQCLHRKRATSRKRGVVSGRRPREGRSCSVRATIWPRPCSIPGRPAEALEQLEILNSHPPADRPWIEGGCHWL